jgi:2',3'-cyclic-nucleotide 2'-phosphodiesterase (5'-nucleotidase family)
MQFVLLTLLCCGTLLLKTPYVLAQQNTMQIILAAEMPDIADTKQARYSQLKYLIDNQRQKIPNTFFLFGGGSIGPSALSNLDRGSHIVDILNTIEPDAMGVTKREFSYLVDELSLRSYEAAFPMVASNIIDTRLNTVPDGLTNMALITRNNVKLGFISITDPRIVTEYLLNNIVVNNKAAQVRKVSNALRKAGADFIFLHYFDQFPEIQALFDEGIINYAFNSHTRLSEGNKKTHLIDERTFILDSPGHALVATFTIDNNFPLVSLKQINLSKLAKDPVVENQVNSYLHRLNRLLDDNIAFWANSYTTRKEDVRGRENAFANFVVDAMRNFAKTDIALINSGSIRGDRLYEENTQITRRTIATELPFRPVLSVIEITGQELLDALEVSFAGLDSLEGAFLQISGMTTEYDSSGPSGQRVLSVYIGKKQLDVDKKYRLATTDYLSSGGDGYLSLQEGAKASANVEFQAILISDLVQQTLRLKGTLDSQLDQRLVDKADSK